MTEPGAAPHDQVSSEPGADDGADAGTDDGIVYIDGGDLGCSRLFIVLRNRIKTMPDGTLIHLTTRDPIAPIDLPVWCRLTGHQFLGPVEPRGGATFAVRVTATPTPTRPDRPWHTVE